MMYKRKDWHEDLCVMKIDPRILNTTDVMVTDMNAASDYRRFYSPKELNNLDSDLIFSRDWRHADYSTYLRQKSCVCAEILIPNYVPSSLITGVIVSCNNSLNRVRKILEDNSLCENVEIDEDIFFR